MHEDMESPFEADNYVPMSGEADSVWRDREPFLRLQKNSLEAMGCRTDYYSESFQ